MLRHDGYDVLEAEHGARALELLAEQITQPCLILLDLMMPVMSGPEFLKVLIGTNRLASLPVVFVSACQGGSARRSKHLRRIVTKTTQKPLPQSRPKPDETPLSPESSTRSLFWSS
jgi:CheY-like chemotaxis protein